MATRPAPTGSRGKSNPTSAVDCLRLAHTELAEVDGPTEPLADGLRQRLSPAVGRHQWTIERTMAWLAGRRRLHRCYERKADPFLAFTSIVCTLICYRRLTS